MNNSSISILSQDKENTFSDVFWRKIREDMRMEILVEKKPYKALKLYEVPEEDLQIDLNSVTQWSQDNSKLYFLLKENGFADFICNKESVIENYTELIFDKEKIAILDPLLLRFHNLTLLRLNKNRISVIENLPANLKELHLYSNPIISLSNKLRQDQLMFLGLGYCLLSDQVFEGLIKKLPNLVCLDLAHNNFCDLELILENSKMLKNLKILALYGNPIVFLPQYQQSFVEGISNLKYFDELKAEDIRNRILQEYQERQAAIQLAIKLKEEQAAKEAEALKQAQDKAKKGKQPPPQAIKKEEPPPVDFRMQSQPSKTLEDEQGGFKIQIKDVTQFKIILRINTLENLDGILLDKQPEFEKKLEYIQSRYWLSIKFFDEDLSTAGQPIMYESATIENEKGRIDFEYHQEFIFKPSQEIRDFIEKGFAIIINYEQPQMMITDEGESKPKLGEDNLPIQESGVLGVVRIELDWLRGQNKDQKKKYYLFKQQAYLSSEFWYPYTKEAELIESHQEFIQKEIKLEEDEAKKLQAEIDSKKEQLKAGKGKDQKKKDDKKGAKKGKDEPEKKVIGQLDWQIHNRKYVFVNDTKILRATNYLLAVSTQLTY